MKHLFICLLIVLANMNFNLVQAASERQSNQVVIETSLPKPFNQLHLSADWVNESALYEADDVDVTDDLSYQYSDNEDVTLNIAGGNRLSSKKPSLQLLEKQLMTFAQGQSLQVPLLNESFGITLDDWQAFKQANFTIEPKMAYVVIKGQKWLKTKMYTHIEVTSTYTTEAIDGLHESSETVTYIPLINNVYYSLIKDRIYMVSFSAPSDLYATYEALFASTMQGLY